MRRELARYEPIAKALVQLMTPYLEVVIHDLKTGKIAGIYHNFSNRKAGDDSLLDMEKENLPEVFDPYMKTGLKGGRIKSNTAVIRNDLGKPIGFFCMNLDLSMLDAISDKIAMFTTISDILPETLFHDDWREKMTRYLHQYLNINRLSVETLTIPQRQKLVNIMHRDGAFAPTTSVDFAAGLLKVSRATLYKDLNIVRKP